VSLHLTLTDSAFFMLFILTLLAALPIVAPQDRQRPAADGDLRRHLGHAGAVGDSDSHRRHPADVHLPAAGAGPRGPQAHRVAGRSEEHTSELQSRENLVCRLLLENKNIT